MIWSPKFESQPGHVYYLYFKNYNSNGNFFYSDHEYEPVNPPSDQPSILNMRVSDNNQQYQESVENLSNNDHTSAVEHTMLGTDPDPQQLFADPVQKEIQENLFNTITKETIQTKTKTTSSKKTLKKKEHVKNDGQGKLQQSIKNSAYMFKSKIDGLKKPDIRFPTRPKFILPNFKKLKFVKPMFDFPKISNTTKTKLPSLSSRNAKNLKRQLSTESNAGDSKNKSYFKFRSYPSMLRKKGDFRDNNSKNEWKIVEPDRDFRSKEKEAEWGTGCSYSDNIRIPLHMKESDDEKDREDIDETTATFHVDENVDVNEVYLTDNQEINNYDYNTRWLHGSFSPDSNLRSKQVTDLDSPGDNNNYNFDTKDISKDIYSSENSIAIRQRGVIEEIDSDEFFLRQKGISQDNIEVGMYLSSEIREAFKTPVNTLSEIQQDQFFENRGSNQSLPETPSKIKAQKKRKTYHVSREEIAFDQEYILGLNTIPPSRPNRKNKSRITYPNLDERYKCEEVWEYENMEPMNSTSTNKSVKSLSYSDHDSTTSDHNLDQEIILENVSKTPLIVLTT